ncbi:ABC transporter substrate-binding protein [Caldinitratiruptor microaerophilus]|uniref:ABC transporter substrate-binding protein n=1 Tax=Caldinitratiruptor microaerophilus TaxID=671077 RepID=A0AA35CNC0_9FIRM|nr:ABC transporter substrate-binding protein [Caldinitratiruptor microaerophilus]BDG61644.1 ABC transporter substrate-binding protein [Caldinitratiruptor microaerophilus]
MLRVALDADPPKLDPHLSSSAIDRQVQNNIFDKLVELDEKLNVVPELATEWKISEDGKVYTFKLRQGVKFHDGTDFNAEAVKFNFERMLNPELKSPRRNEVSMVEKVEVLDPYTVAITLQKPFSPFLGILTDRAGMMVSPAAVQKYGNDGFLNHPVGTGPFKFESRIKGDSITLVKNESYWRQGLPKADKVIYKVITDQNVAVVNLQSGQVDILDTRTIPDQQLPSLRQDKRVVLDVRSGLGYQGLWLNVTKPPFDNKWLRKAVDAAIDRETLVKVVFGDAAKPGWGPFPPSSPLYDGQVPKRDLAKTREFLEKGGKPNGFEFTLSIAPSPETQKMAQVIQGMLAEAGIRMNIQQVEWGQLLDDLDNLRHQAGAVGWSGRAEPDQNIYAFHYTGGGFNNSGYSNPVVDQLLDKSRVTQGTEREQVFRQVLEILRDDVPYIYLYYPAQKLAYSPKVKGLTNHPDGMIRLENVTKE